MDASRRHRAVDPTGLTSLMSIGEAMRRRAWVWCAAGLAGLVVGVGLYVLAPPAYQAQSCILVTNDVNADPGLQIQGDIEIAQNAQVAEGAMDKLGSRRSVSAFLASYSVTAVSDRVLQITTRARSADAAVREANAIATAFLEFRAYVLTTQQLLGVAALHPLVALHKRQFKALTTRISRVTAEPRTRARRAELRRLRKQYRKASSSLGALVYTLTNYPALTQSMVQGTAVLDPAAPVPPSRRHVAVLFAMAGLICGLGLGFSVVIVSALMSDRPRNRDDVARLLGSVVYSLGRPRAPAWRRSARMRLLCDRLREAIPDRGPIALAVVAVDSVRPAALALAALAVSYARDGRRVVLADLSGHARAARVLGVREPGVHQVAPGVQLAVVVPQPGDVGPVRREPVDLLLSLAELDPAVGADQLATWATDVAVVMTTGRSAPKTIQAVGEMVRRAGLHLAFGVLLHADKADESLGLARQPSRVCLVDPLPANERWVGRRVGLVWSLLTLNVLTFYSSTWSGLPLAFPIPSSVGKVITQGSLAFALLAAITVNRRLLIRPSVFLCILSLLVVVGFAVVLEPGHFGTIYRTFRFAGFVATLWLLTPFWGRRDMLLVRCYLAAISIVLGTIALGLVVAPRTAYAAGRLEGAIWPYPPTQVAHFAAVTTGLVVLLWLCGLASGRLCLVAVLIGTPMLLLTHTRTALLAMVAGIFVAGLSLFTVKARVRKLFAAASLALSLGAITLSGVVTTWLARGESPTELTTLTGRTTVWDAVLGTPRNLFETTFGFGMSNLSFNGLSIDSNWLGAYLDLGLIGVALCAAMLLFLLVSAYFQPVGPHRAVALFLVTFCLLSSFTETGLSDPSLYLLELTLAASLLVSTTRKHVSAGRTSRSYA